MKFRLLLFLLCISTIGFAQIKVHAHNDYLQSRPFIAALNAGAWSIEVGVLVQDNILYVAHSRAEIDVNKTLKNMYLEIAARLGQRKKSQTFQLMIDIKDDFETAYPVLIKELKSYINLFQDKMILTISGNRPLPGTLNKYPKYLNFDGVVGANYTKQELAKITMFSANFEDYSNWNGIGELPDNDKARLIAVIDEVKRLEKPMRFWNAPDNENAWRALAELGVEIINTDNVSNCIQFLNQ